MSVPAVEPAAVAEVRAGLPADISSRCSDQFLQHWLQQGDDVPAAAAISLKEHFEWRDEFGYETLSINSCVGELRRGWLLYHHKVTAGGQPVITVDMAKYNRSDPSFDIVAVMKLCCYIFRLADESATKDLAPGAPHPAMIMVCDMLGYAMKDFNEAEEKMFQDTLNKHFVRLIGPMFVVNTPWYFRLLWNIVKQFMSKKSKENTHVLGDPKKLLTTTLDASDIEARYGGSFTWNLEEFIASRQAIEGTEDTHVMGAGILASMQLLHTSAASLVPTQTKAGALSKKGSGEGAGATTRWQSRYFVINKGVLMYFKSKSSVCPRRCMPLAGAAVREAQAEDTSQAGAFVIEAKGRHLVVAAKSDKERAGWLDTLRAEMAAVAVAGVSLDE